MPNKLNLQSNKHLISNQKDKNTDIIPKFSKSSSNFYNRSKSTPLLEVNS